MESYAKVKDPYFKGRPIKSVRNFLKMKLFLKNKNTSVCTKCSELFISLI